MAIAMPVEPEANELLGRDPLALLIGMVLDQQVPLERAFSAPLDLARRLGHEPTTAELADFDPDALAAVFSERPALHRYPRAMAGRVQEVARLIMDSYDGQPERLWTTAQTGAELLKRVSSLPGFGAQKAKIFVALLGKQFEVQPPGWREAAGPFGAEGSHLSVADIRDAESLARVRSYKQELKAAAKAAQADKPGQAATAGKPGRGRQGGQGTVAGMAGMAGVRLRAVREPDLAALAGGESREADPWNWFGYPSAEAAGEPARWAGTRYSTAPVPPAGR